MFTLFELMYERTNVEQAGCLLAAALFVQLFWRGQNFLLLLHAKVLTKVLLTVGGEKGGGFEGLFKQTESGAQRRPSARRLPLEAV